MSQTRIKPNRGPAPEMPRWVKLFGIIAIGLILLFVILHLTGNSPFGDHMSSVQNWLQQLWR